ncbi:MAG: serine/threonine protein kinase [Acidobacteria bacterium]|nr:serine/threonine protein kinase [Acidobacteriota bacterium]
MIDRWQQVKQILHDTSALPKSQHQAFVVEASEGDSALIEEVESLLASFDEADNFLEESPIQLSGHMDSFEGRWIGEYRIDSLIANGGMGSVYKATKQMDGATLPVALKLIRFAGNQHYLSRRFRMERQILSRLTHENILRLLDGGVTPEGLPYIVTEFLDATNLEPWLRDTQPTLSVKLNVFQGICDGVAHAHRNLIVHGDLKPSNILITRDGTPKLVDFGIARLLNKQEESGESQNTVTMGSRSHTLVGQPRATPRRASQHAERFLRARPHSLLPSHRGQTPRLHRPDTTAANPRQAPPRAPPKPSTLTNDARLRGDLDNITLKALEFERSQRYRSVDAFSDDIARHIDMRPVLARP